MRRSLFVYAAHMHRDLQNHHGAIKAVKTAPVTRPLKTAYRALLPDKESSNCSRERAEVMKRATLRFPAVKNENGVQFNQ